MRQEHNQAHGTPHPAGPALWLALCAELSGAKAAIQRTRDCQGGPWKRESRLLYWSESSRLGLSILVLSLSINSDESFCVIDHTTFIHKLDYLCLNCIALGALWSSIFVSVLFYIVGSPVTTGIDCIYTRRVDRYKQEGTGRRDRDGSLCEETRTTKHSTLWVPLRASHGVCRQKTTQ